MRSILDDIKLPKTRKNAVILYDFHISNTTKNFKLQANSEGLLSYSIIFKITNLQIPWLFLGGSEAKRPRHSERLGIHCCRD